MYIIRKLKFHHGRMNKDGIHIEMLKDVSMFSNYAIQLCNDANKISKTQFVGIKSDHYDNWTIKIKTRNKDYFNIVAQRFVNYFGNVISEIRF